MQLAELFDVVRVLQYDPETIDHKFAVVFGDGFQLVHVKSFVMADSRLRGGIHRGCSGPLVQIVRERNWQMVTLRRLPSLM